MHININTQTHFNNHFTNFSTELKGFLQKAENLQKLQTAFFYKIKCNQSKYIKEIAFEHFFLI